MPHFMDIPERDNSTQYQVSIDSPHHEIHAGETFRVCKIESVLNDANFDYLISVAGTKEAHFSSNIVAEGKAYAYLYKSPTVSANGTQQTTINMNDNSSNTSTVLVYLAPTVTSPGTDMCQVLIPGGTGPQSIGSEIRQETEWVLKPGLTYLIRITNKSGQTKDINCNIQWYEHTPKA